MKKMNVGKRMVTMLLVFALVIGVVQLGETEDVSASQRSEACEAYRELLTKNQWESGVGEGGSVGSANYFAIKDLNGDKVPELILNVGKNKKGKRAYTIFTYYKDELVMVYETWICEEYYYDKESKCFITMYDWSNESRKEVMVTAYKLNSKGEWKTVVYYARNTDNGEVVFEKCSVNDKETTYKKAKAKFDKVSKNKKALKTPYKVNKANIEKYVK